MKKLFPIIACLAVQAYATQAAAQIGHGYYSAPIFEDEWRSVYQCENNESTVYQNVEDPSRYELAVQNEALLDYLDLRHLLERIGSGEPVGEDQEFVGYSKILSRFGEGDASSKAFQTLHVFPNYGGLKVEVETAAFYRCNYDFNYGDSGGLTHTYYQEIGKVCPNLYPSYSFRDASPGQDQNSSKNWFFQNCQSVR